MIHNPFLTNFNIRISSGNNNLSDLSQETFLTISSDKNPLKINPKIICADPFLLASEDKLFLFYEELTGYYNNGQINLTYTEDLINWSTPKVILKEKFHLSFPHVFEIDNQCHMIPESHQDRSIRLYTSISENHLNWKFEKKLINDEGKYVDTSLSYIDGIYFMFTTKIVKNIYYQLLFTSDSLYNEFKLHPSSPIFIGNKYGRNAGSIFNYGNQWFRPAQDCSISYGSQVSLFKIDFINQYEYKESLVVNDLIDIKMDFYKNGGHHYNRVCYKGKEIVATDARKIYYNVFRIPFWMFNKVSKCLK